MSHSSGGGQPIPTPTIYVSKEGKVTAIPHHWWFDRHQTGIFNSSPPGHTGFPNSPPNIGSHSSSFSSSPPSFDQNWSPPDPKVAIPMPAPGEELKFRQDYSRRDSLRNLVHLNDFGTD